MTKQVWIVFDLGFGDAGKGATVDFLVRECRADLVVRYNGGAQAGHNVVTPAGEHHTFSQIGAGTFVPGTRTLLGNRFVLHPGALRIEAQRLEALGVMDSLERTSIDQRALVISPFQQAAGRLRELQRRHLAHGTCGVGVGETVSDALRGERDLIRAADLLDRDRLVRKLTNQRLRKLREILKTRLPSDPRAENELAVLQDAGVLERTLDAWRWLPARCRLLSPRAARRLIQDVSAVVFEGAQGVLLDQDHGFHPHTTWSDCTSRGAWSLLRGIHASVTRLGVLRSYMVRHGPGPFPTHDLSFDREYPEAHNDDRSWQGRFRRGPLDFVLLRYALEVCGGADGLALNCLDRTAEGVEVCCSYQSSFTSPSDTVDRLVPPRAGDHRALLRLGRRLSRVQPVFHHVDGDRVVATVEQQLGIPICLCGAGPSATDRRWLRAGCRGPAQSPFAPRKELGTNEVRRDGNTGGPGDSAGRRAGVARWPKLLAGPPRTDDVRPHKPEAPTQA
jgi:adenylosuccinate synthase